MHERTLVIESRTFRSLPIRQWVAGPPPTAHSVDARHHTEDTSVAVIAIVAVATELLATTPCGLRAHEESATGDGDYQL